MGCSSKPPIFYGAPGAIRTPDPHIRSVMLYPAELRVRNRGFFNTLRVGNQGEVGQIVLLEHIHQKENTLIAHIFINA